jgi:hypothetical protein
MLAVMSVDVMLVNTPGCPIIPVKVRAKKLEDGGFGVVEDPFQFGLRIRTTKRLLGISSINGLSNSDP